MKLNITSPAKGNLSRKVVTFLMALLLVGLSTGIQAQDRITVEPDDFPAQIGALNIAIEQGGADKIYVLRNGKTYWLDGAMEFDHALQIEAEEYPSDNPPIIRPATNLQGTSARISTYKNNILMRGIFFYAIDDLGGLPQNQRTASPDIHLHYQHCYFMAGNNYFWWLNATGTTIRVEDSQFANAGRFTSGQNQRLVETRGNDTDSLIFINSSVYNILAHIISTGFAVTNYIEWNHMTVVNHGMEKIELALAKEAVIKNSLWHNTHLLGVWESKDLVGDAGPGYDGPRYYGHSLRWKGDKLVIQSYEDAFEGVENPPLDSERSIVIKNNNWGGLPGQEVLDLWEEFNVYDPNQTFNRGQQPWGTDPAWLWANPGVTAEDAAWATRDTIQLVRIKAAILDSILDDWKTNEVAWATIENNIEENVTIADMPDDMLDYMHYFWYGADEPGVSYDRWAEISADPFTRFYHPGPGTPVATTGSTASLFRNLAYNTDSESYTAAEMGYPLGNLNFYPDLKELWLEGVDLSTVSVEEALAEKNGILAYPNPAKNVLHLGQEADEIIIYNVLGKQVLRAKNVQSIDVSDFSNGVYILNIVKNNRVSTQKVMVNR